MKVCIPGLHLSLGIFNRLWTLLEKRCKEIDFSLAIEGASVGSFPDDSADKLTKWSNLQSEVKTSVQYAAVIADLLTYSTVTVDDFTASQFHSSLVAELESAQRRRKDLVNICGVQLLLHC